VGFKSLGDRTFLLAADDECDRIEQPCFVRAHLASASGNQGCQCQRQNGLNFQVSLPAPALDRKYRKRQIRRALRLWLSELATLLDWPSDPVAAEGADLV
jgi:hypothetical protein